MKLRPKYRIEVDNFNAQDARKVLHEKIKEEKADFEIQSNEYYLHIYMPENERKIWTPYMAITFEEIEPGVIVRANIGPSGKIWLPFWFVYSFLSVAILFVSIYGLTQLSLHHPASILYSLIPMFLIISGMYLASYIGQKKSANCIIVFDRILNNAFKKVPSLVSFELK